PLHDALPLSATVKATGVAGGEDLADAAEQTRRRFHAAMLADFDTPVAIAALFELARDINRAAAAGGAPSLEEAQATLIELAGILGLDLTRTEAGTDDAGAEVETLMQILIEVRARLREERQFAIADFVRDRLQEEGFILEDTRSGTSWKRSHQT